MQNLTFNNASFAAQNHNKLKAYTSVILISDISSFLIRTLLCIGIFKCRSKCHPLDVSCLILANLSFNYGLVSWVVEYIIESVDSIQLHASLSFICYLVSARQIFWSLSSQSLVFLSFNRVYLIHRSLWQPTKKIHQKSVGLRRWGFSIVFHSSNFTLLLAFHLTGYFTNSVVFKNWKKCNRSTTSDLYIQINYLLRNMVPTVLMIINYVIIVPIYMIWHLRQSKSRKTMRSDMQEKRTNKVIKLSLMHLIYTFFQASSWLISTAITEFIFKNDTKTKPSSPRPVTMFELFFGSINNEALIGVWWLEFLSWLYMILDLFNPLILILLHTHLHRAVMDILCLWKTIKLNSSQDSSQRF